MVDVFDGVDVVVWFGLFEFGFCYWGFFWNVVCLCMGCVMWIFLGGF